MTAGLHYDNGSGWVHLPSGVLVPGDPPPPTGGDPWQPESTLFGMRFDKAVAASTVVESQYKTWDAGWQGFDNLNAEYANIMGLPVGTRIMTLNRTYSSGTSSSEANKGSRVGVQVHHSMKCSKADLANGATYLRDIVYAFVQSRPVDQVTYYTMNHEPENDFGGAVSSTWPPEAQQWREGQAIFAKWVIEARGDTYPVIPVPVIMDWTVNSNNNQTYGSYAEPWDTVNIYPEYVAEGVDPDLVCFGIDHYRLSPTLTNNNILRDSIEIVKSFGFTRTCFPEFAGKSYVTSNPNDRANWQAWIQDSAQIFIDEGVEHVCYYFSNNGNGTRPNQTGQYEGWFIYGTSNKQLWSNICLGNVP